MWLTAESITIRLGGQTIIDNLSLALAKGEIACLLGRSGCGKTTVLRSIAGFEPIVSGSLKLNQTVLADDRRHVPPHQRGIGMVFQDYALFPHLSVAKNIAFGLGAWDKTRRQARVGELLDLVGLAAYAQALPHQLSGGQQQRVALARALAPKPALVLLDEPFSNLDVALRQNLSKEVRRMLKHEGIGAILVTHDQQEAFAVADSIGVIHQGRLQQWASPYDLYHTPANRYVADFIGQGVLLPGTVTGPQCVQLELGEFCGLVPQNLPVGQTVQVLLRPDDVVHDDSSPLSAQVLAKDFKGEYFTYTLALPSGHTVLAQVPSHHDHAVGSRIGIVLQLDHLIAFAA